MPMGSCRSERDTEGTAEDAEDAEEEGEFATEDTEDTEGSRRVDGFAGAGDACESVSDCGAAPSAVGLSPSVSGASCGSRASWMACGRSMKRAGMAWVAAYWSACHSGEKVVKG